jgi:hypothetical protein
MAEIRSTLEMVLERAAKMAQSSQEESDPEEKKKQGMKLAAGYMKKDSENLVEIIIKYPEAEQVLITGGAADIFLRYLTLPREPDQLESISMAMDGLLHLSANNDQMENVLKEAKTVLEQYTNHRNQLEEQLAESFTAQAAQLEQSVASQTGMGMQIDPRQHPKFQEEWQRVQGELNDQYDRAIDQYKTLVKQLLGIK